MQNIALFCFISNIIHYIFLKWAKCCTYGFLRYYKRQKSLAQYYSARLVRYGAFYHYPIFFVHSVIWTVV